MRGAEVGVVIDAKGPLPLFFLEIRSCVKFNFRPSSSGAIAVADNLLAPLDQPLSTNGRNEGVVGMVGDMHMLDCRYMVWWLDRSMRRGKLSLRRGDELVPSP